MRRVLPLLAVAALAFAPAPLPRASRQTDALDLGAIQGEWQVDHVLEGGQASRYRQGYFWRFSGDQVVTVLGDLPMSQFTLALGKKGVPRPVELVSPGGGGRSPGHFRLRDGRLELTTIQQRPGGQDGDGPRISVWVLERKRP